jgi:hypothetical protein
MEPYPMSSYAYTNRSNLPGNASTLDSVEPSRHAFDAGREQTPQGRASTMVTKDHPHPAPHPSPDMAHKVDRSVFDQRWQEEARAARKAAFMATRNAQTHDQSRAKIFNCTVTRSR